MRPRHIAIFLSVLIVAVVGSWLAGDHVGYGRAVGLQHLSWERRAKTLKVGSTLIEVMAVLPRTPASPFNWNGATLLYWVDDNTEVLACFGLQGPALSDPVRLERKPLSECISPTSRSATE